ncbi:Muscleblind-like protein 2 [Myotis davidii]|uniref:Muscleblind-like protein 2 n=1 Tax=Myotis davidii TaxID=225400 RepID=L5MEA8_MYODS|nr:Muscleblind-like protein 2 [Myotis davidii]
MEKMCGVLGKRQREHYTVEKLQEGGIPMEHNNSEIISRNGMECQESALRITKHCYCTYYPVSSSIELPQTAC